MNVYSRGKDIVIEGAQDFNLADIFECGQCFHCRRLVENENAETPRFTEQIVENAEAPRFTKQIVENAETPRFTKQIVESYEVVAYGRCIHVSQTVCEGGEAGQVVLHDVSEEDYHCVWHKYFDMDTDYGMIKREIAAADSRLEAVIRAGAGIRILRQDFFEMLISFIISQNKQIPHIRQLVHALSERYGTRIEYQGRSIYAFPVPKQLYGVSEEEFRACKVGFRAPYIRDAVEKVYHGEISEERLLRMSVDEARKSLMSIHGVGEKVANCVLLFGLGFTEVFPVDVWMQRIMESLYFPDGAKREEIECFAYDKFGSYAGYAQQYLFAYGRENKIGK